MSTETTPQPTDPDLADIMSRLADGDMDAMGDLKERYGHRIRGVIRRIVKKTGRRDILNDPDEIEGLTTDAILIVVGYAGTWKPWGALPWTWAYKAIEEVVWSGIGHRVTELEEWHQGEVRVQASGTSPRGLRVDHVFQMADSRPELKLFLDVLGEEASERDVGVVLEYELQKAEGVRAPSETTAILTGLTAPNVRKIASRTRKKMIRRVGTDPALAVLEGFWFLSDGT
mgnify:FL=1